ncbi:pyocin knob domain-containing protein [Paenibacillus thiaminolyticus]|uniref:pyocin knob domain-containing protein n=1 Tax=Paenibacillus thiaminolyticus TaxID=49283 RepID=UPI001F0EF4CF|nr:pyocin knob domain-containing protein [Paenibacillus thiaminolyticus]WCR26566.1 pyocin knob domain-containing protein [Paenibacillus thiaminolyticus]
MAFQKPLPEWKQPGIRPPESKIKEGYQVLDKPPAAWLNWQMNTTYEALQELQEKAAEKEDVSQALGEAKAYTDEKVADIDLTKISPESIGAAKKADLDAHASDAVKHITVAERAAWNQAETNAKSYIDAKPWQRHKVSGDDGAAIDITNRDLNSIVHTGFYRGTNLGNAPALLHGWGYVEVITHAPGSWVLQKVYDLHADRFYMRRLTDSGWTAWTQDLFQSGVDAKTRIAGAISAKGVPASANDTFDQLAQKISSIKVGSQVRYVPIDFRKVSSRRVREKEQRGTETYKIADVSFEHVLLGMSGSLSVECEYLHSWWRDVQAESRIYLEDGAGNKFTLVSSGSATSDKEKSRGSQSLFNVSTTNRIYQGRRYVYPDGETKFISETIPDKFQLTGPLRLMCDLVFNYGVGNDYGAKLTAEFNGTLLLV